MDGLTKTTSAPSFFSNRLSGLASHKRVGPPLGGVRTRVGTFLTSGLPTLAHIDKKTVAYPSTTSYVVFLYLVIRIGVSFLPPQSSYVRMSGQVFFLLTTLQGDRTKQAAR